MADGTYDPSLYIDVMTYETAYYGLAPDPEGDGPWVFTSKIDPETDRPGTYAWIRSIDSRAPANPDFPGDPGAPKTVTGTINVFTPEQSPPGTSGPPPAGTTPASFSGTFIVLASGSQVVGTETKFWHLLVLQGQPLHRFLISDLPTGGRNAANPDATIMFGGPDGLTFLDPGTGQTPLVDNPYTVCFLEGTRILTRTGYRPVEGLMAGDEVFTLKDGWQAVRWIGKRVAGQQPGGAIHPGEYPVRIARDAFGPGLPERDLWVSPDHGVYFRDHLIPAKSLVNGRTVSRDPDLTHIAYYHVLLDRHAVIFSEALPTESYIPFENAGYFENQESIPADLAAAMQCRIGPMVTDCYPRATLGPVVETARAFLAAQAPEPALDQAA